MASHWKSIAQKKVYQQNRLNLVEHQVLLPSGKQISYTLDHGRGAVATLIVPQPQTFLLSYQYRFPIDDWIYDLPGGEMDENENPLEAAIRECQEEVGVLPETIAPLAHFYPNPSKNDWPIYLFFCSNFSEVPTVTTEPSESVQRRYVSFAQLEQLIDQEKIIDPALLIAWYTGKSRLLI